jgi:hypothetical protein
MSRTSHISSSRGPMHAVRRRAIDFSQSLVQYVFRECISNNTSAHHTRTISILSAAFISSKSLSSCVTFPVPTLLKVSTATAVFSPSPLSCRYRSTMKRVVHFPLPSPSSGPACTHLARRKVLIHRTGHLPREILWCQISLAQRGPFRDLLRAMRSLLCKDMQPSQRTMMLLCPHDTRPITGPSDHLERLRSPRSTLQDLNARYMLRSTGAAAEAIIRPADALRKRRQRPRRPAPIGGFVVLERCVDRVPEKGAIEVIGR